MTLNRSLLIALFLASVFLGILFYGNPMWNKVIYDCQRWAFNDEKLQNHSYGHNPKGYDSFKDWLPRMGHTFIVHDEDEYFGFNGVLPPGKNFTGYWEFDLVDLDLKQHYSLEVVQGEVQRIFVRDEDGQWNLGYPSTVFNELYDRIGSPYSTYCLLQGDPFAGGRIITTTYFQDANGKRPAVRVEIENLDTKKRTLVFDRESGLDQRNEYGLESE